MANETMVTIPLEEYMDLRKRAEENLYLATKLGAFEDKLWNLESKLLELEGMVREWTVMGMREKLIDLLCESNFMSYDKQADHIIASGFINELQNEAYDLGVDSVLHHKFGLSWDDAAELRKEVARLQAATKWIPVTERLPEENTAVLTYRESGIQAEFRWHKGWDNDEFTPCQVTHWMPLPEPPKEVLHTF